MGNGAKKDRDVRLKKEMVQMMGERDESIRQAFEQFDQKVGQGFQGVEYKFGVIFAVLQEMGVTEEKLNEIGQKLQAAQQAAQAAQAGGEQHEQTQAGPPIGKGVPGTEEPEQPLPDSNEGGDEHFG